MKTQSVSKFMSLVLRHKPELIGLHLDEHGWASVDELAKGVKVPSYIVRMIAVRDEKRRFMVVGNKIRANYGHSIKVDLEHEVKKPPHVLYHGTTMDAIVGISEKGILPMDRQKVHLTEQMTIAKDVGGRHGPPVILTVRAREMDIYGFVFQNPGNGPIWTVSHVPTQYIANLHAYQQLAILS